MKKLLIIEDNPMVARMIKEIASSVDIEVIGIADSWAEAENIIHLNQPDFATIDINIKGSIDGIQAAKKLKKIAIESLFLTAYKDLATIKEATDITPMAYMIKPITPENLTATFLLALNKLDQQKPSSFSPTYKLESDDLIYKDQELIPLSKSERIVLMLLLKYQGQSVKYELLFDALGDNNDTKYETALRNIITKIRKKCSDITIKNVKDVGYIANIF